MAYAIELTLDPPGPVEVGAEVVIRMTARSDEAVRCARLRFEAGWCTTGRGETDGATVFETWARGGPLGPDQPLTAEFRFRVPPEGPLTYIGRRLSRWSLLTVEWSARVALDVPEVRNPEREIALEVVPRVLAAPQRR